MRATVHITLKKGVLDPQGEAIRRALGGLGFEGVGSVRQGKVLELELEEAERRWVELQHERIDPIKHSGGDFGGDIKAGVDVIYMNKRIDAAQGRAELETRIAELRRVLESRRANRERGDAPLD